MCRCRGRELGRKLEISRTELESIARKKKTKMGKEKPVVARMQKYLPR